MYTKQKRIYVNGYLIGNVVSGLDFDASRKETAREIYGESNAVNIVAYAPGPQSIEIMENPSLSLVNEVLAGFTARNVPAPVIARAGLSIPSLFAVVETMNSAMTGYAGSSTYLGYWAATLGGAKGDPGAEAVRTLAGNADVPMELLRGGQFMSKRVTLSSNTTTWDATWASPVPQSLPDLSDVRAVYLEIQSGTGRTRTTAAVAVDSTNVTSTGSGGKLAIAAADVSGAGFSGTVDAWVIFAHNLAALQTHDCRYPLD